MQLIPFRKRERTKMATNYFIIAFTIILTVANAVEYPKQCPNNEIFSECGNHGCQNTCASPDIAARCRAACNPGCICKEGYLRNTKKVCVPALECDTCKSNEIFDLCGNTGCVNTCAEPDLQSRCLPEMCIAGCICLPGYLRDDLKKCVKPKDCKPLCTGANELFDSCGETCPTTCANKEEVNRNCDAQCREGGGCICKPGYIRGWNRNCIKPEECPTCDGPNEFFSCGSACDATCATLGEVCPIVNFKCNEMCYCKEGFARDSKGVCISIKDCPPTQCKDDPNAITVPCGDPCPLTCENKDDKGPKSCIEICIINGCKCKDGFVKGSDGKCIPVESCPAPIKCRKNEIYDKCPPLCPPEDTCRSYVSGIMYRCAPTTKCVPACRCKEGYIRNAKNGKCIHPDVCCGDPNSEMVTCPNPCPGGTCDQPDITPCKIACRFRGCQCKEGFVKKSATDPTCVATKYCKT
ncbi:zonadhesin-like [Arctopsyche grandis]|uniref:zonadhesin-like n=1 Tax=Arctopsyche grandis TaxID=121162 RepID=UPI00406D737E